jgi:hypothetical protein
MTPSKCALKRIFLYSILFFSSYIYANEPKKTIVKETTKSAFNKITEGALEATSYVSLAMQINTIVDQIRAHNFPTKEEEEHAEFVADQYALLAAEDGLEKCLIKNKNARERTDSGIPTACKEIAEAFVFFGGQAEVDRMTAIYSQYRKQ